MKYFINFFLSILFSLNVQAIRFVGNGGGDAELKIITYLEGLPLWLEYCSTKNTKCIENVDFSFWKTFLVKYQNLNITEIEFVNEKDYAGNPLTSSTSGQKVILTYESLYISNKESRSDSELFSILMRPFFKITNEPLNLSTDSILILPQYKKHPELYVYAFESAAGSKLFSPFQNLNSELIDRTELKNFKIVSETASGYVIENFELGYNLEMQILPLSNSRYQIEFYPLF